VSLSLCFSRIPFHSIRATLLLSIRYSPEVVDYFRATGSGWQTRMDEALKEWMKEHAVMG